MSDFAQLLDVFGVKWDIDSEKEFIDATVFGDISKTYLVRETWTVTYQSSSGISGVVTAHTKEAVEAATLNELFTRLR